jgi:hypothetical protein
LGAYAVIAPSDSKPGATKQVSFKLAKDKLLTKATDGVTAATVTIGYAPTAANDLSVNLEASANPFI